MRTNNIACFAITLLLVLLFGCDANQPEIACLSCDTENVEVSPDDRVVLVEEFTGVRCVQCPAGASQLKAISDINPGRLVIVGIHSSPVFSNPIDPEQNFRTPQVIELSSWLGDPQGYPSVIVDRIKFDGQIDLHAGDTPADWAGPINEALSIAPFANMDVQLGYNSSSRRLDITVNTTPLENVSDQVNLTVMITESNIIGPQLFPTHQEDNYKHDHVLRSVVTSVQGDQIQESFITGSTINTELSTILDESWNHENCEVIAFIHRGQLDNKEVLQAAHQVLPQ